MSDDSFVKSISVFVDNVKIKQSKFVQQFCFALMKKCVEGTPVDTGFARASWYASLNDPDAVGAAVEEEANPHYGQKGDWEQKDYHKTHGSPSIAGSNMAMAAAAISQAGSGDTVYIMNNCAYIYSLEFGHSKQAPNGMARIAVAQADNIAKDVLASLGAP